MFCPARRSKRFRRYGRRDDEFFCPACKKVVRIDEIEVPSCYKCGRVIYDYSKAVRMGNDKHRHVRCKRQNKKGEGQC